MDTGVRGSSGAELHSPVRTDARDSVGRRGGFARRVMRGLVLLLLLFTAVLTAGLAASTAAAQPAALREGGVRVVYWPGQEGLARRTLEAAQRPLFLPGIARDTTLTAGTIYLAPSPAVFDSLTGGRVPEWGAGVAIPALRMIVLPTYPAPGPAERDPATTLRHELAHLVLHAYLPGTIPRWFDEGYATWVSGGWDQSSAWQIRAAFVLGRAPPLDSLVLEWPRGAEQARLAYLLSASAVQYLIEIGGEDGFTALLDRWREEGSFDVALRRVYGMTPGQFEQAWAGMVRRRYGWLLAASHVTVFWVFASFLMLVLFAIRRRRNRERLAALEREDRLQPPPEEYWAAESVEGPLIPAAESPAAESPETNAEPGVDSTRQEE